jgi:hypothetical protein
VLLIDQGDSDAHVATCARSLNESFPRGVIDEEHRYRLLVSRELVQDGERRLRTGLVPHSEVVAEPA